VVGGAVGGAVAAVLLCALLLLFVVMYRRRSSASKITSHRTVNAVFVNPLAHFDPNTPDGVYTESIPDEMQPIPSLTKVGGRIMLNNAYAAPTPNNYYESAYPAYSTVGDDEDDAYSYLPGSDA